MKINPRHGDWTFKKISQKEFEKLSNGGEEQKHSGSYTWAEGEATGHFHTLVVDKQEDMSFVKMPDGSYLVKLAEKAKATHPEHSMRGDLQIDEGYYIIQQRREKDWFQLVIRRVID